MRHLLVVPTNVSAVSFNVGIALLDAHSIEADAGDITQIERLAAAVKWSYRRFRTFPLPTEFNRFCTEGAEPVSALIFDAKRACLPGEAHSTRNAAA